MGQLCTVKVLNCDEGEVTMCLDVKSIQYTSDSSHHDL